MNCLKASIDQQKDWVDCLQSIVMAYRAGVYASTGKSPYEVMFGLRMRMPVHLLTQPYDNVDGDAESDEEVQIEEDTRPHEEIFSELENVCELIHQSCAANISTSQARQAKNYDARHRGAPLQVGDLIMNYNTKAKQRKGDRMAPNWTGPYTIIKVHKNGNYSVKNSKGETLTTKMCASNVKLWQEPTDWESEPALDWVSAQLIDDSEPTVPATPTKFKSNRKSKKREQSPEPWIAPPPAEGNSSSKDSDYEGEPPVKTAQYPVPEKNLSASRRPSVPTVQSARNKKVRFTDELHIQSILPPASTNIDNLKTALNSKVKKKKSLAQQKERKTAQRLAQKIRKDDFFEQMMKVNELPNISDITVLKVEQSGEDFTFLPLILTQRKTVCDRVSLIMRKTNIPHSQVGEKLGTREPRVTRIKGDGNGLFRGLSMAVTGWETGHLKIRQLVCVITLMMSVLTTAKMPAMVRNISANLVCVVTQCTEQMLKFSVLLKYFLQTFMCTTNMGTTASSGCIFHVSMALVIGKTPFISTTKQVMVLLDISTMLQG